MWKNGFFLNSFVTEKYKYNIYNGYAFIPHNNHYSFVSSLIMANHKSVVDLTGERVP